ncbi:hypothetical protein SAMN05428959_105136 [Duganella sp. CF517]|uniref:hypothetical protein n=1 Tax=Duganella sp. CF517 TaxID=1881038 RepID=UPI0008B1DB00|nr:hypothetical protein [Duganella sp. CF517]SEO17138.1 hypothetical protein SAMN05428959_105136 [Duganella sp. CF517]
MTTRNRLACALAALAAAIALGGCAVQSNGKGGILVGVDNAQLFGTTVGTFQVKSGAEGTLRRAPNNGAFSVKLSGSMRVVPLPNAQSARIARVLDMGTRTVVVIETQERACPFKYQVLSIEGSDVLQWGIGNCGDRPRVEAAEGGQALYFDFAANGRLQRNIYIDGRMLNAGTMAAPGVNLTQRPFADADLRAPGGGLAPWQPQPPAQPQSAQPARPQQRANDPAPSRTAAVPDVPAAPDGGRVVPQPPHKADGAPAAATAAAALPPAAPAPARRATAKASSSPAQTPPPMTMPTEEVKVIHLDLRH